jgi:ABC-type Fe3+ transport system substrate-binding protein
MKIILSILLFLSPVGLFAKDSDKTSQLNILTSFPPNFYQPFKQAFNQIYPNINVHIRNKKTTASINYLQRKYNHNIDLFWASSPDAFEILQTSKRLQPLDSITFNFPPFLHSYPLKEAKQHYLGFALSGYGIMFNQTYLNKHQLTPPQNWQDLGKPKYYAHFALSSPSRSGTTHLMIEMILQHYGWDKGWNVIMKMAGNIATITARSYGVPDGVKEGRFGLGLVIDYLSKNINSDNIKFNYANETSFLPASIALLKNANNSKNAHKFINFLLSTKGQTLLQDKSIARLPIDPKRYRAQQTSINPFLVKQDRNKKTFNTTLSRQRYELVNHLFDHFITFQLTALQRLWAKVNVAEQKHHQSKIKLKQIQQLKQQLIAPPINEKIYLSTPTFGIKNPYQSTAIVGFLPAPIGIYKQKWLSKLNDIELALENF